MSAFHVKTQNIIEAVWSLIMNYVHVVKTSNFSYY